MACKVCEQAKLKLENLRNEHEDLQDALARQNAKVITLNALLEEAHEANERLKAKHADFLRTLTGGTSH